MLEAVGIHPPEERIYRLLLRQPGLSAEALTQTADMPLPTVEAALAALEDDGLVSREDGLPARYLPSPPDAALEALLLRRREELERARIQVSELVDEFRRGQRRRGSQLAEVVIGREEISKRFEQLQRRAREQVLVFDKPPYATGDAQNDTEIEVLGRGVRYRCVYDEAALSWPGQLEQLTEIMGYGEEARAYPELPMRLAIADRSMGLIPLALSGEDQEEGDILIHASPLLDALIMLFELVWTRATPLQAVADALEEQERWVLDEDGLQLVALIAAGMKDEVIARQLGVTPRTVQRRVRGVLQATGTHTRIQLAVHAARQGWI